MIQKLTSATLKFTSYLGVPGAFDTYTEVTNRGKDGLGNSVYAGLSKNSWPSVLIVKPNGVLLASSINDKSCQTLADAQAKADYAVEKKLTRYWDSNNLLERYYLSSPGREPKLVKTTATTQGTIMSLTTQATPVQARIKGLDEYTWLRYNGAPLKLKYKGKAFTLSSGEIFGVRPGQRDSKRMVVARPDLGITRVMTIGPDLERILSKSFNKKAPTLQEVEQAIGDPGSTPAGNSVQAEVQALALDVGKLLGIKPPRLTDSDDDYFRYDGLLKTKTPGILLQEAGRLATYLESRAGRPLKARDSYNEYVATGKAGGKVYTLKVTIDLKGSTYAYVLIEAFF